MTLTTAIPLDERDRSAIDLAIVANRPLSATERAELREALEESQRPFRIGLVDYARVPPSLQLAIDRGGIAWPIPIST